MERVLDRVLNPEMVWVLIPLLAILVWGVNSIIRSARGGSGDEFAELHMEIQQLRGRIEQLERAFQGHAQTGVRPPPYPPA